MTGNSPIGTSSSEDLDQKKALAAALAIADMGVEETVAVARIALRHAKEYLRLALEYDSMRCPYTEQARRVRRAYNLVCDAINAIE